MSLTLILLLGAVIVIALFVRNQKAQGDKPARKTKTASKVAVKSPPKSAVKTVAASDKPKSKFTCTAVVAGKPHCAATEAIKDKRFLPAEVPALPLAGCTMGAGHCHCHYTYFKDRRHIDRRNPYGATNNESIAAAGKAPRQRKDRRKTPHVYE